MKRPTPAPASQAVFLLRLKVCSLDQFGAVNRCENVAAIEPLPSESIIIHPMNAFSVSLAQINIQLGQPEQNLLRAQKWIAAATQAGSSLILFPELWTT